MYKKRQFNFFFFLILLGLLLLEGPAVSVAQDQGNTESAPQEEHNTEDLEALLKKYNKDSEKILEDASKLHKIQEGEAKSEVNDSDLEEMQIPTKEETKKEEELALKRSNKRLDKARGPIPSDLSTSVRMALEPLQKLSEADLLKRLDDGTKGSAMRPYFQQFPSISLLSVRLIKDKESLPSLVKIVENKDRLIYFVGALLCTVIFGFWLKGTMHKEGRPFLLSAALFLVRLSILLCVRITLINYFFGQEIAPALKVFNQTFIY